MLTIKRVNIRFIGQIKVFTIAIFILSFGIAHAGEWAKVYDLKKSILVNPVAQQTSDGGYIVAGTVDINYPIQDIWIMKLDGRGNIQWSNYYRTISFRNGRANSIQQTSDGGYIVGGSIDTSWNYASDDDIWILKLDGNGNVLWHKILGFQGRGFARTIQQTDDDGDGQRDDGYIVAGTSNNNDLLVLKLDGNGNVLWQKVYREVDGREKWASSIHQTLDGGFILAGTTTEQMFSPFAPQNAWVLKLDGNGKVLWHKTYDGPYEDNAYSIQQTSDGGYIMAGNTTSLFGTDLLVLKLDGNGNVLWQKTYDTPYPYPGVAYSVQQASDGNYIVAGTTEGQAFPPYTDDFWVLKLDVSGNVLWQKTYGSTTSNDRAFSIHQTLDGGYIIAGNTVPLYVTGDTGYSLRLIKLDEYGNIGNCPLVRITNANVRNSDLKVEDSSISVSDTALLPKGSPIAIKEINPTVAKDCSNLDNCDDYIRAIKHQRFFKDIKRIPLLDFPLFIKENQIAAVKAKATVLNYLLCLPDITNENRFQPPICLDEPITTGGDMLCPPLDCFIDGPGCMNPYQFSRSKMPDSVLHTVGLWSKGSISEKEFSAELMNMVRKGQITVEKERPKKIRYLPKLKIGSGILFAVGLIVVGFTVNSLYRKLRRKK